MSCGAGMYNSSGINIQRKSPTTNNSLIVSRITLSPCTSAHLIDEPLPTQGIV